MTTEISDYFLSDSEANKVGFRSEKFNIPFFNAASATIKVKLLFDKFSSVTDFNNQMSSIRQRATNRILLHYYPEFYGAYRIDVRGKEGSIPADIEAAYQRVRTSINNPEAQTLTALYYVPHNPAHADKHVVEVTLEKFKLPLTYNEVITLKDFLNTPAVFSRRGARAAVEDLAIPAENETTTFRTHSPIVLHDILALLGFLPDYSNSLAAFNADEEITPDTGTSTLVIGSLMNTNNLVNDGLASFQRQLNGFEGSLPINLDFTMTQKGMMTILNAVVTGLLRDLTDDYNPGRFSFSANSVEFTDADLLTITFGRRRSPFPGPAIARMDYLVNEVSSIRQPLRTGHMTNVLYNSEFNDPLILATLKNYQMLVRVMEAMGGPNAPNFSFVDFLQDTPPGDFGLDSNFVWDDLPSPVDTKNIFLQEAAKYGVIDMADVKNLEQGFKLALKHKEMRKYRQMVRDNPEVYRKVLAENKRQSLKAAKDVTKGITSILDGNLPGIKNNSSLGLLLRKIGIDQLAKEAMICLTFGLAPAFARLTTAVQNAITDVGLSVYDEPDRPMNPLTMPEIDLSMFEVFTIDGDLWPQIRKVLIDTLMEGVLEIIKALAQLLKELCTVNNPRAEDFGANDLGRLVSDNANTGDALGIPTISNQSALNPSGRALTPRPPGKSPSTVLEQVCGRQGLTYDQVMQYLTDLSAILSSMEICFLFTDRESLTYATIQKILDFNLEYPDLQIRATLNSHSAILGFFANLAKYVDLTDLCNEIANEVLQANIDNLCLLEEAAPDRIDEILQQLSEGVSLANPGGRPFNGAPTPQRPQGGGINLECPRRPGFIENPMFNTTIPGLLDTILRVVEEDFVNSVGSAQQALKEPQLSSNPSVDMISDTMRHAGVIADGAEEMSAVGKQILKVVAEIFGELGNAFDYMQEYCDVGQILGVEAEQVEQVADVIIDVMNELLNDPEFAGALAQIESTIDNIAQQNERTGGAPPAVTYDFPTDFTNKFNSYIQSLPSFRPEDSFTSMESARLTKLVESGEFSSTTPTLFGSSGYSDYKAANLRFSFPTRLARSWQPVEGQFYGNSNIQRFTRELIDPNTQLDSLVVKFPTKSSIEGDPESKYLDISLKSALLPTYEAALNFNESAPPTTEAPGDRDTNPYVALFSDEVIDKLAFQLDSLNNDAATRERYTREVDTVLFPSAYGGFVDAAFAYIEANGVFDIDRLNSLNFFHDNANCIPENVADLLDISSIKDELNEEMLDAMCYDVDAPDSINPMGTKIREVIRYGLFLLFIQIHVAQFIIKNIFVFSAFDIDHLMGTPLVKEFMAITIRQQAEMYLRSHPEVGNKMVEYFNKKINRNPAIHAGGIKNALGEIVFETGTEFGLSDFPQIIEYITANRIINSKRPVANAVKNASSLLDPKPFNKAFIEDMLTIQPGWLGAWEWGDVNKANAYIYVPQNPALANGEEYGKYTTSRRYIRNWGTEAQESAEIGMLNHIKSLKDTIPGLSYGKIVLERYVTWDAVEGVANAVVPPIIQKATGQDYGIEKDLFRRILFSSRLRRAVGAGNSNTIPQLKFTNLNMRYEVVYYMPESFDETDNAGPEKQLFADALTTGIAPHLKMNFGNNITFYRIRLKRLGTSLALANEITTLQSESKFAFNPNTGQYEQQDVPILKSQLEMYTDVANNSELLSVAADPVFKDYFGKTFNRDLMTLVPIMHNFYLTTNFFPKFDKLLLAPKVRVIDIFLDTIRNENAIADPEPRPSPQAEAANRGSGTSIPDNLQQSALEFILKMFIETPINILRGVSEMMDPHVGLSKIIRDITGMVFFKLTEAIDATPPIQQLRGPNPDPNNPEQEIPGIAPNISGEGVLRLLFCLLTIAMEASAKGFQLVTDPPDTDEPFPAPASIDAENFIGDGPLGIGGAVFIGNPPKKPFTIPGGPGWEGLTYVEGDPDPRDPRNNVPPEIMDNFFPRITVEGVDFTGTFLGLLMLPPGPFGIVYLLLMLLKSALEEELGGDSGSSDGAPVTNVSEDESGSEC